MNEILKQYVQVKITGNLKEDIAAIFQYHQDEETLKHVLKVAEEAIRISNRFGVEPEEAEQAALLHDVSNIIPVNRMVDVAKALSVKIEDEELKYPRILHQKLSRAMAEQVFGITNPNILNAIECHTTLKSNASQLDKVLFIADKLSWESPGQINQHDIRQKVEKNELNQAILIYLNHIWEQRNNLKLVHSWTIQAREDLLSLVEKGSVMLNETITDTKDLLDMLDSLLREPAPFWNGFYSDRSKDIPFFVNHPDENLKSYYENGLIPQGNMLEIGCGPGRNAIYSARQGFTVDAVDISDEAIRWAKERAEESKVSVNFECKSAYDLMPKPEYYDFVYDSGCLHHIWPHRRIEYLRLIYSTLKPGGFFGLTCFAPGYTEIGGALELSDYEVYRERSMKGGQAYSKEKLFRLLGDYFDNVEFRSMKTCSEDSGEFGVPFMWASLWRKK
jgi:putative HD superfamily hydrolase of NAD metabolism